MAGALGIATFSTLAKETDQYSSSEYVEFHPFGNDERPRNVAIDFVEYLRAPHNIHSKISNTETTKPDPTEMTKPLANNDAVIKAATALKTKKYGGKAVNLMCPTTAQPQFLIQLSEESKPVDPRMIICLKTSDIVTYTDADKIAHVVVPMTVNDEYPEAAAISMVETYRDYSPDQCLDVTDRSAAFVREQLERESATPNGPPIIPAGFTAHVDVVVELTNPDVKNNCDATVVPAPPKR
jgi:hypothetical protein